MLRDKLKKNVARITDLGFFICYVVHLYTGTIILWRRDGAAVIFKLECVVLLFVCLFVYFGLWSIFRIYLNFRLRRGIWNGCLGKSF